MWKKEEEDWRRLSEDVFIKLPCISRSRRYPRYSFIHLFGCQFFFRARRARTHTHAVKRLKRWATHFIVWELKIFSWRLRRLYSSDLMWRRMPWEQRSPALGIALRIDHRLSLRISVTVTVMMIHSYRHAQHSVVHQHHRKERRTILGGETTVEHEFNFVIYWRDYVDLKMNIRMQFFASASRKQFATLSHQLRRQWSGSKQVDFYVAAREKRDEEFRMNKQRNRKKIWIQTFDMMFCQSEGANATIDNRSCWLAVSQLTHSHSLTTYSQPLIISYLKLVCVCVCHLRYDNGLMPSAICFPFYCFITIDSFASWLCPITMRRRKWSCYSTHSFVLLSWISNFWRLTMAIVHEWKINNI